MLLVDKKIRDLYIIISDVDIICFKFKYTKSFVFKPFILSDFKQEFENCDIDQFRAKLNSYTYKCVYYSYKTIGDFYVLR